jgi:23S rRNA (cytosine1962-C5)-methyltransferase
MRFYDRRHKLGEGFYNKNSLISLRLLDKSYDGDFVIYARKMILDALELRRTFYPNRNSYRLIFSESDFMPGLIIDKYNDTYVLQIYCFGMQKNIISVVNVLKEDLGAKNIFSQNEGYFRKLEGLPEIDHGYIGVIGEEVIDDGKIKYEIDLSSSQKTGFYFDQCDNRDFIEKIVKGKKVLDAFCNSGGFGLHAAFAGASWVTFLDSSAAEIKNAWRNFSLNSLNAETEFVTGDIFEFLQKSIDAGRKFDVVMIDPPAFAKSRKSFPTALKGYIKLNKLALSLVSENGYLVTSSCSHHVKKEDFFQTVTTAAQKASRELQLIHYNGASLDHPELPAMEETSYLKFAVFRVF